MKRPWRKKKKRMIVPTSLEQCTLLYQNPQRMVSQVRPLPYRPSRVKKSDVFYPKHLHPMQSEKDTLNFTSRMVLQICSLQIPRLLQILVFREIFGLGGTIPLLSLTSTHRERKSLRMAKELRETSLFRRLLVLIRARLIQQ